VDQRVRPKRGEDAHLFLRVMQGMEPPQRGEAVIRPVGQPVAPVHGHDADTDGRPAGNERQRREHDPRGDVAQGV
jgi:hypothetical protein